MQKNLLFILFISLCVLTLVLLNPTEPSSTHTFNLKQQKEYMVKPIMSTFTEEGQLKHNVAAKHWEYKPEANLSSVTTPQTTLFNLPKPTAKSDVAITTPPNQEKTNPFQEEPITIQSDSAEFDDKKGIATYHQHVTLDQENRHLRADTLIIQRNARGTIAQITATGTPAYFTVQPPGKPITTGYANTIHYFPEEDKILFIDNAELTQKGNIIRGDYLSYFFKSEILSSEARPGKRTLVIIPKIPTGTIP